MPKLCPIVQYRGGKNGPKRASINFCQINIKVGIVREAGMDAGDQIEFVVLKQGLIGIRKISERMWSDNDTV